VLRFIGSPSGALALRRAGANLIQDRSDFAMPQMQHIYRTGSIPSRLAGSGAIA